MAGKFCQHQKKISGEMGASELLILCCFLGAIDHDSRFVGSTYALGVHMPQMDKVPARQALRGGGEQRMKRRKDDVDGGEVTSDDSNAGAPPEAAGMANGLLQEMKELFLKDEIPEVEGPATFARQKAPKTGPGSRHRTPQITGWARNLGGDFGVELPGGGLAGGGLLPEPKRVAWATRLANSSDAPAHLGHKLVQLCDNVSFGIDPVTEKGPFYLDIAAAVDCIDKVCFLLFW